MRHRCENCEWPSRRRLFLPDPIELRRPADRVLLPAKHYNYRGIPFVAYVTPEDLRRARGALHISDRDADTFDITSYYLGVLIALSQDAVEFLEQKLDAYPVINPLAYSMAILISIGTGRLSNRGRQANHGPYCP